MENFDFDNSKLNHIKDTYLKKKPKVFLSEKDKKIKTIKNLKNKDVFNTKKTYKKIKIKKKKINYKNYFKNNEI